MPAGYSGTPLAKKLGIKPGAVVAVLDEPAGFRALLEPVPDDVVFRTSLRGKPDLVIAFFTERNRLESRLPAMTKAIHPDGGLWLAWPKTKPKKEIAAGRAPATDLNGTSVRELGLASSVVDIKVCAIDDDWSGLRFAHRVADR